LSGEILPLKADERGRMTKPVLCSHSEVNNYLKNIQTPKHSGPNLTGQMQH